MKSHFPAYRLALLLGAILTMVTPALAQAGGNIEFTARVTPTDARPEPVRQMTFYLLNKSLADIRGEAAQSDPAPDRDKFVDGLDVSPELKAWMKKNKTVDLAGSEFIKNVTNTPADIVNVPEFFKAYMAHTPDLSGLGFPKPKYKEKDKTANPEKYKELKEEYAKAISKFITAVPDSVQGMDVDLIDINPYQKWTALVNAQKERVDKRASVLAQTQDLIAQTDTNLDGKGLFSGLPPGEYWVGTLDRSAIAGDVRLGWDVPVTVRAGETTRVDLNNVNGFAR